MSNPKGIVVQKYGYICSRYSRENTIDPQRQQEVAMHTTVCGRGNTQTIDHHPGTDCTRHCHVEPFIENGSKGNAGRRQPQYSYFSIDCVNIV
jgi:hypothetical protein